jgi:hypothetical protein
MSSMHPLLQTSDGSGASTPPADGASAGPSPAVGTSSSLREYFPNLPQTPIPDPIHAGLYLLRDSILYELALIDPLPPLLKALDGSSSVTFATTVSLPTGFESLQSLLSLPATLKLQGTLTVAAAGTASFDLTLDSVGAQSTLPAIQVGPVKVYGVTLHVRSELGVDGSALTLLECDGLVDIGTTAPLAVPVSATYESGQSIFHFSGAVPHGALTLSRGTAAIGEWIGGAAADLSLPSALTVPASFYVDSVDLVVDTKGGTVQHLGVQVGWDAPWTIASGLQLTDLQIGWTAENPFAASRSSDASVAGTLVLGATGKAHFDVTAARSAGFTFAGKLRAGDSLDLGGLVSDSLGFDAGLPLLQVDSLAITAASSGDFAVTGEVTTAWSIDVDHQTVSLDQLTFSVARKGTSESAQLTGQSTIAGTVFAVEATLTEQPAGASGIVFQGGTLDATQSINLTRVVGSVLSFFNTTLPSNAPDVSVKNLGVTFNTATTDFTFQAETDGTISVPFVATSDGNIQAAVSLSAKRSAATGTRVVTGFMEGQLKMGPSTFTLQYSLGQTSHVFVASWASDTVRLGLDDLLTSMGTTGPAIPAGVDLGLKSAYLEYQAETQSLTLSADSANYGDAFFVATEGTGGWQFVFGLEYQGQTGLSAIPVLGQGLSAVDSMFSFDRLGVMIASADVKGFTLPTLPPLQSLTPGTDPAAAPAAPANAQKPIGAGAPLNLKEGISFVGVIDFDKASSTGAVGALRKVVPQSDLTITASYGEASGNVTLSGILDGSISIPTGGSSDLVLGDADLSLIFAPDEVNFRVSGDLTFGLAGRTFDVQPALTIGEEEALFSVDVTIAGGWPKPMGIQGMVLDEIDFSMGVTFLPAPGLVLGLEGKSHFTGRPPSSDDFAFVLEMVEEVPDPLLLSFYVDRIDLPTALSVYTGVDASTLGLPNVMSQIAFTDVSFYWCESVVTLPDGSIAQPGLRFGANLQILSFDAFGSLAIDATSGIAGEILLPPIHLGGVLDVTGKGTGMYRELDSSGKVVHTSVAPGPGAAVGTRTQVIAPGGAMLKFQTKASPFLIASVDVTLFDFVGTELDATVTDSGMQLKVVYWISTVVKAELDVTLDSSSFQAHSDLSVHLKADLGPIEVLGVDFGTIHLDAGFDLSMSISASATAFSLSIDGEFDFEGARLTIPTLTLSVSPSSLKDLPAWLLKHVEDNVEEIFSDLYDSAKQKLEDAAKAVAAVAVEVGDDVAKVATQAAADVVQVTDEAKQGIETAAADVAAETQQVVNETAQIATAAAQEVTQVAQQTVADVEQIGTQIAQVAEEAAHEVDAIGNEIAQEADQVAQQVTQIAQAAVQVVEQIGTAIENEASQILSDAESVASSVVQVAQDVANDIENAAEAVWNEVQQLADAVAAAAEAAANAIASAASSAWHEISKY